MNKKYGTISLILVVILATVFISGCIGGGDTNTSDKFPNEETILGLTFYLPDGFEFTGKMEQATFTLYAYSDGTDFISITVYKSQTKEATLNALKSSNVIVSNIDEQASFGGYSGISLDAYADGKDEKVFIFEKGGKAVLIEMSSTLDFESYVPKIIG